MHQPRKRFGQNFLTNQHIIQRIIQAIAPKVGETIVEIGPGFGALTKPLLQAGGKIHAIELDRDIIPQLKVTCGGFGELIIHEADVTQFDLKEISDQKASLRIVGNLPYNISTQLIFHLLKQRDLIRDMHFMLQKELVDRMVAAPGSKIYGRLSIMVQYYYSAQKLFTISPRAFNPAPRVNSAIIRLTPHLTPPYHLNDEEHFALIVREAFNHRRKTVQNALKGVISPDLFQKAGVDPKLRPEQLTIADFVRLSNCQMVDR